MEELTIMARTLHLTNAQFAALFDILAETVEYIEGDLITTEDENGNEIRAVSYTHLTLPTTPYV